MQRETETGVGMGRAVAGRSGRCLAGVFTRAPEPGYTKTRLIPLLGSAGAAELHRCMLLDTLERVERLGFEAVTFVAPATGRRRLRALGVVGDLHGQGGGPLGARMARALLRLTSIRGVDRAFLVGSDCPDLPERVLRRAARLLQRSPVVLAPAQDGGYTLIGTRRGVDLRPVLRGVPWSTAHTLAETVARLCAHDLAPQILEAWWDVDEPADVTLLTARLQIARALGRSVPPRTARCLGGPQGP